MKILICIEASAIQPFFDIAVHLAIREQANMTDAIKLDVSRSL